MFKFDKAAVMTAIMITGSLLIAGSAIGDDNGGHEGWSLFKRKTHVAPVTDALYKKECGSCHFAYQPGLLPSESWKKVMATLDDHFGDNAELAAEDQKAITDYLVKNSAEKVGGKVPGKIAGSVRGGETVIAISKTPYFVHKHREIPARMVTGNPQVKSFAHCAKCHTGAESGSYNEHDVNIPGFGAFDD